MASDLVVRQIMYFWNIKKLSNELINSTLSQRSVFLYILIYVFGMELSLEALEYFPQQSLNNYDYIETIIYLVIVFVGTCLAYYFNGGKNGKEFAERYFSISFVVGVRFMAVFVPLIFIELAIFYEEDDEMLTTWYEVSISLILMFLYYWRTIVHMKYVANKSKNA